MAGAIPSPSLSLCAVERNTYTAHHVNANVTASRATSQRLVLASCYRNYSVFALECFANRAIETQFVL